MKSYVKQWWIIDINVCNLSFKRHLLVPIWHTQIPMEANKKVPHENGHKMGCWHHRCLWTNHLEVTFVITNNEQTKQNKTNNIKTSQRWIQHLSLTYMNILQYEISTMAISHDYHIESPLHNIIHPIVSPWCPAAPLSFAAFAVPARRRSGSSVGSTWSSPVSTRGRFLWWGFQS